MAPSSVLGKRQRAAAGNGSEKDASTIQSPSKRRARQPEIHDDHQEPSKSPIRRTRAGGANTKQRNVRSKRTVPDSTTVSSAKTSADDLIENSTVNDENAEPPGFSTPKGQRYRNALPVTPKHRVQVGAKPFTPRTPRTMTVPKPSSPTVYSSARQLFVRSSRPGRIVGRDSERDELHQFIQNAIQSGKGGCMYVSGPPGTGKSALVDELCKDLEDEKTVKLANVNCASMTSARDIYGRLAEELCDDSQVFKKSQEERLRSMFLPKRGGNQQQLYLVTLDEIDHLLTTDLEILYNFFELSLQRNSRLILIGIANALDLTDRFLPRLKAKNLKPQLLPFLPYTSAQIAKVITSRLKSQVTDDQNTPEDYVPFLQPAAIQLCARKVASQSGDLRKAFDLVARTIDAFERELAQKAEAAAASACKAPLTDNTNLASPPETPSSKPAQYTASTAPRATVAHVARITSAAFGHGTTERLQGLNLQQKAALCALVTFGRGQRAAQESPKTPTKSPRSTAPTVKQLFNTYSTLCRRDKMLHPLTVTEFRDVVGSLEAMGLVGGAQESGRGRPGGSMAFGTPTRTGRGANTSPSKSSGSERGLVCFVSEKEVQSQITGPGEAILRTLLREEL